MEAISIRRLKPLDADAIRVIYRQIIQAIEDIDFNRIVDEQTLKPNDSSFVAELDGRLIGYIIANTLTSGFGAPQSIWITNVGVDPSYMGQGVGAKLANEVFAYAKARRIDEIYSSVRWDATDLLSFFKKLGFDRSNFINLRKIVD